MKNCAKCGAGVKLTGRERTTIAKATRAHLKGLGHDAGYGIDDATAFIETRVEELGRFDEVAYADISDYALGLARFVCSREAREW